MPTMTRVASGDTAGISSGLKDVVGGERTLDDVVAPAPSIASVDSMVAAGHAAVVRRQDTQHARTEDDAEHECDGRLAQMQPVADEGGEEGISDEEDGEDEVGEVGRGWFELLPHCRWWQPCGRRARRRLSRVRGAMALRGSPCTFVLFKLRDTCTKSPAPSRWWMLPGGGA